MIKPTKCEICNNNFSINTKGYVVRRKIGDKLACSKCYQRSKAKLLFDSKYTIDEDYKTSCGECGEIKIVMKNEDGRFICKPCLARARYKAARITTATRDTQTKMTTEERNKLARDISAYKRERTEYLKSIPPEDLIAIVMGRDYLQGPKRDKE